MRFKRGRGKTSITTARVQLRKIGFEGKIDEGFYRVEPPYLTKRLWSKHWSADLEPQEFGFIHPRFGNKAVSAMLDGHAEVLSVTKIQDMRHWSNLADNPGWILKEQ